MDVKTKQKKSQPNTIRAYLNSLHLYVVYLKHRREQNVIGFEDYMPEQLTIISERIKRWSCSLVKNSHLRMADPAAA